MAYYYNSGTEFVKMGGPIHFTTTTDRYNESPYTAEDCSATIEAPYTAEDCSATIEARIYPRKRISYINELMTWSKTPPATKEDLVRYIKNDVNLTYDIAKQIEVKGDDKVYYFIKDVEVKKKVSKKGSCMQYNFILYGKHAFLTVENYDEDCTLSADFILSIAHICYRCEAAKLIFRDHKVIAVSKGKRYCGDDEKTGEAIWKHKSYVANCMDADNYNPYIGAMIAINKCVADSYYKKDSKSHLRRLREKIDRASEDA